MADQNHDPSWGAYQQRMDEENLRTLVILHRVYGGITAMLSCCVVGYITFILGVFGIVSTQNPSNAPPAAVGVLVVGIWGLVVLLVLGLSIVNFLCANWLRDRRNWVGVIIVSGLNCLHMPLGTALGVFTLIVVNRSTVRPTFQ